MKIYLKNTASGLIPCTDDDYEAKRSLKIGEIYSAEIREERNYQFLRKYYALINCAWAFLTEKQKTFIQSKEGFRKTLQIAAGYSDVYYSIARREWVEESKSIAFDNMAESEFSGLYEGVKLVLFSTFLKDVDERTFTKELINF